MATSADVMDKGVEHKPFDIEELSPDRQVEDAKEGKKTLANLGPAALVEYVKRRVRRLDKPFMGKLAELKVNWLRYKGNSYVQIHPSDTSRIWNPPTTSRRAPTINKIERSVDRYIAQITADEPIMEGVPSSHRSMDRDAAEAATMAIRAEWQRMRLHRLLQRVLTFASVLRSGFWFFQYDRRSGDEQPAMKYFTTENGEKVLFPVDSDGKKVSDIGEAAKIRSGNMTVSVLTPANVRWSGGTGVHDATEVMVTEVIPLRDALSYMSATREAKVRELLAGKDRPIDAFNWLSDIRSSEFGKTAMRGVYDERYIDDTAGQVHDGSTVLDEPVVVTQYFRKRGGDYPDGYHVITVGNFKVYSGTLRYGVIPVAQFRFLDDLFDDLGRALVDLLKDPQELLDFVNGQILRYLQMLKRRWFVPMYSNVKARDLLSPTRSIIEFNPAGGQPVPEVQPEIPNSMVTFVERFDAEYKDQVGLHATSEGIHVPGVGSGRHAEALRSADETLLGLTRIQVVEGLEHAGSIMLAIIKKEWTQERRVRFLGDDRAYVEKAFKATDFGDTTNVALKESTMLMLTPAQRLETIMTWGESGILKPEEMRALAPLGDVAGISLTESKHYQRARRQNARYLAGPPKKLETAYNRYKANLESMQKSKDYIEKAAGVGMSPPMVEVAMTSVANRLAQFEMEWRATKDVYAFDHRSWEDRIDIARIHADVHAEALATDKSESFPEWWQQMFEEHATMEWKIGFPEQQPAPPPPEQAAGGTPPGGGTPAPSKLGAVPTQPIGGGIGMDSGNHPGVVQGNAP